MRPWLYIYYIIEDKKICKKTGKLLSSQTSSRGRQVLTEERLEGCGAGYQGSWASQEGIWAGFPEAVSSGISPTTSQR